ncbi:MAG TPA: magnesium/cobalt transporter CorA [Gemmatimonadota bacterium]
MERDSQTVPQPPADALGGAPGPTSAPTEPEGAPTGPALATPTAPAAPAAPPPAASAGPGVVRVLVETPNLTWLDLDDPGSPALDELAERYGFHELAVEDCRNDAQLAKLDPFPEHLFLIANSIRYDQETGDLHVKELDVFMGERFIVTVHDGPSLSVESVAAHLAKTTRFKKPAHILHALLDAIQDRFLPTLDEMGAEIDRLEEEVLESPTALSLSRLFQLRRNLVNFRRAASAQRELLNALSRRDARVVPPDTVIYFRDIYDHVVASMEMIESYRDLVSGVLDIYLTRTANRTNDVVKALTLIATIILPLTLITGWYGMNVVNLPLANDPNGVWYVTGGMAALTLGLLIYFRTRGWI